MSSLRYATIKIYIASLFCQHKGKRLIKDYKNLVKGGDVYAVRNNASISTCNTNTSK